MVIKGRISRVFAKTKDRNYVKLGRNLNKTKNLKSTMKLKVMESGNKKLRMSYDTKLEVRNDKPIQIQEGVFETIRLLFLTKLNKRLKIEKIDYLFRINKVPHQILRLKTSASAQKGVSVDRISCGMKNSFGKPFVLASKINREGQLIFEIYLSKNVATQKNIEIIANILKELNHKLPFKSKISIHNNRVEAKETDSLGC